MNNKIMQPVKPTQSIGRESQIEWLSRLMKCDMYYDFNSNVQRFFATKQPEILRR
jgi:hypothetical protein